MCGSCLGKFDAGFGTDDMALMLPMRLMDRKICVSPIFFAWLARRSNLPNRYNLIVEWLPIALWELLPVFPESTIKQMPI